jgi:pimeloyl-ACP methyl ester carboxylesterase
MTTLVRPTSADAAVRDQRVLAELAAIERELTAPGLTGPECEPAPSGTVAAAGPVCLFVPGRFGTPQPYTDDPDRDIRLFLTARGVDVHSVDHPATVPDDRDAPGTAPFVEALGAALRRTGDAPVVLIGHSMGAFLCYLAASRWPERVAGIVALDGGVVSPAPRPLSEVLEVAGAVAAAQGWESMSARADTLRSLAAGAAAGRPGAVRALARVLALAAPGRDGCMVAPGDDPGVVPTAAAYLSTLAGHWPRRQTLQARLLAVAGPGHWPDASLSTIRRHAIPVFAGLGGAGGADRLARSRHTADLADPDAEIHQIDRYGHLDVLFGPGVRDEIFEPVLRWLTTRARPA